MHFVRESCARAWRSRNAAAEYYTFMDTTILYYSTGQHTVVLIAQQYTATRCIQQYIHIIQMRYAPSSPFIFSCLCDDFTFRHVALSSPRGLSTKAAGQRHRAGAVVSVARPFRLYRIFCTETFHLQSLSPQPILCLRRAKILIFPVWIFFTLFCMPRSECLELMRLPTY